MYSINDSLFDKLNKVARANNDFKEYLTDDEQILVETIEDKMFEEAQRGEFELRYCVSTEEFNYLGGADNIRPHIIVEYFRSEGILSSYAELPERQYHPRMIFEFSWSYENLQKHKGEGE